MRSIVLVALIAALIAPAAEGAFSHIGNVTPDVIYGSGIDNGSWNVYIGNGVELGLRARQRGTNVINIDSSGYYHYSAGSTGGLALWDFEFAANVGSRNLQDVRIDLWIDVNPGPGGSGVSYLVLEDIFNPSIPAWSVGASYFNAGAWGEHEVGTASTGAGGGSLYTSETGTDTLASYSVVQNAENMGEVINGFDPNTPGTYDFMLYACDISDSNPQCGSVLESAWMQVIVEGGEVPEPSTIVVWSLLGAFGIAMGWYRRRKAA